jgi:glycosyltransferase involved in cell wall biosynthesis
MIRVLALTRYSRLGASSRLRSLQYVPFLAKYGIQMEVSSLFGDNYLVRQYSGLRTNWFNVLTDYFLQLCKLFAASKYDVLWIEKELFPDIPAFFERMLAAMGVRYIVDYDDAIFHNYDRSPSRMRRMLSDKIDVVMRNSGVVVCGNRYLASRAEMAGAKRVEIIPTVIDLERYEVASASDDGKVIVGWIGSPSSVKYLDTIAAVLAVLSKEFPFKLRVIGASISIPGVDVECRPWSESTEVQEIQQFSVGVMPLIDSDWERGKCGYKLIQYMACGVPVIGSPVGVNEEIINERNGILASTPEEWLRAFRMLLADRMLRRTMGNQGRIDVVNKYCVQMTAPRIAELIREVCSRSK